SEYARRVRRNRCLRIRIARQAPAAPSRRSVRSRRRALRSELGGLMFGRQRVDQFAQRFARDDLRQLVERQVDAVIGDAALREVIGADALAAVAGADLFLAIGGTLRFDALALG